MKVEPTRERITPRARLGRPASSLLLAVLLMGLAYHALLIFSSLLHPYRFPTPYAVPIFDTPFALAALAVGYLCLERHRLLQDFRSAAMGITLELGALLAIAHILAQPDYPGPPSVNPGVASYLFLLSYLTGFVSIGLATHDSHRRLPLGDRGRFWLGVGGFGLSVLVVAAVLQIQPILPPLMQSGRLTPFGLWVSAVSSSLCGAWVVWGGIKRFWGREQDWFAGFLLLAALIWLVGMIGWLILPFRYAISWYVAGLARSLGVMAIFIGLLQEQVWLYQEARARQRDLEGLHSASQALATSLDVQQTVATIATKALEVTAAMGSILYRLDAPAQVLRPMSHAGRMAQELAARHTLPVGMGTAGLAVAQREPVWTVNVQVDPHLALPAEIRESMHQERVKAMLSIPILRKSGEVFGALTVAYEEEREFAKTDLDLLSAFGAQVSVAVENAQSFEQLARKARNDKALQEFSQRLLETTAEEAIVHESVRLTHDLLQADSTSLFLYDAETGLLRLRGGPGGSRGSSAAPQCRRRMRFPSPAPSSIRKACRWRTCCKSVALPCHPT